MECVFACDIGTSTIKAALISSNGMLLNYMRFKLSKKTTANEWLKTLYVALNANEVFAFQKKIKIIAICISGNGPTLVSVSRESQRPDRLFLWNEGIDSLNFDASEVSIMQSIKNSQSIFLPRIFIFTEKYPDDFLNAKYLFSGVEYLAYKLTGNATTFLPEARYKKAYWSKTTIEQIFSTYDGQIAERLLDLLPNFVLAGSIIGTYKNIPVVAGAPDFFVALLGTKTIKPFTACDRAGTSEGINACLGFKPEDTDDLRLLPSVLNTNWNVSALLGQTGLVIAKDKYIRAFQDIEGALQKDEVLSSYVVKFKNAIRKIEKIAGQKLDFTLTGGQSENDKWNQMKADISGRNFLLTQTRDCELLGGAILGFLGAGYFSAHEEACENIVKFTKVFEPKNTF